MLVGDSVGLSDEREIGVFVLSTGFVVGTLTVIGLTEGSLLGTLVGFLEGEEVG